VTQQIEIAVGPFEAATCLIAAVTGRGLDDIHMDHRLVNDLLMDSLEYLEMAMMIEETWGVVVDTVQLTRLVTVADVARLLPSDARLPLV
jgi:acyl carrier protein